MAEDWSAYFRDYRTAWDVEHAVGVQPEPDFIITEHGHDIPADLTPTAPRKIMVWLAQNGAWHVRAQHSRTHHRPELYAADSKQTGARKGDVKTGGRSKEHYGVYAVMVHDRVKVAELRAWWVKVGKATTFTNAVFWDSITNEWVPVSAVGPMVDWLRVLAPVGAPAVSVKTVKASNSYIDMGSEVWQG